MIKTKHMYFGWAIAGTVVLSTLIGLPKLANASGEIKEQKHWQKRAVLLEALGAEYNLASDYSKTLAENYISAQNKTSYWLDYQNTKDISGAGIKLLTQAKDAARQKKCLAEAIYYEARSESVAGQKAVAEVVLNRVKSRHFPNTICGVVYQGAKRKHGCQFSFACDGSTTSMPYGKHWQRAQDIAEYMMINGNQNLTNRATHYHTNNVKPHWAKHLRFTRQYGTHLFYRFMPRSRQTTSVNVAP